MSVAGWLFHIFTFKFHFVFGTMFLRWRPSFWFHLVICNKKKIVLIKRLSNGYLTMGVEVVADPGKAGEMSWMPTAVSGGM